MTIELKPCPFCGSDDVRAATNTRNMIDAKPMFEEVFCDDCGATITAKTPAEAIEAWNRRALSSTKSEKVDVDRVLDVAGDYMGQQYGNTALHHPIDRARVLAALASEPANG